MIDGVRTTIKKIKQQQLEMVAMDYHGTKRGATNLQMQVARVRMSAIQQNKPFYRSCSVFYCTCVKPIKSTELGTSDLCCRADTQAGSGTATDL